MTAMRLWDDDGWDISQWSERPCAAGGPGRISSMGKTKDIRAAVEAELDFDPRVEATDITVKNVNGEVALSGTVPSYPQYLAAAAAARRVAGVTGMHNHLQVRLPRGDYRDDSMLTTAANNALTSNTTVPPGIEATARDGNLELIGTVSNGSQRAAAERAVAELTGVRNIKDYIDIDPGVDPTNILYLVQGVLDRYAVVDDDSNVEVTTSGTTVTLTGNVRTWAEHDAVVDAAWMAGGVADVRDELSVTG
jgi:osmotically-inducible protein OsmY